MVRPDAPLRGRTPRSGEGAFAALAGAPNLVLAGAAYRGVGLPDCIAQGRAAAARVGAVLSGVASEPTPPVEPGEPAAVA